MAEPTQFGRYLLVKKLASGGMAQVWLARQPGIQGFEKLLVIKRVLAHLAGDESFTTMFLDEARLAARLNHPNVVQVFDLGEADEDFFIAMEYIHGEDLRRLDRESRRARKPIPIPLVCRIVADAAAGLHYAHTLTTEDGRPLGIVHRDVSPQNVLVTFEGGVKVVDFGIAKAADKATKTRAGVLKGKYAYMSPEQAAAKPLDARTDVFALGILLHELLTGKRLFKREGEVATLHAVVSCEVEPPSLLNPVVPPELDPIVLATLERDPERRMADAGQLQLALEDFLLTQRLPASSAHLRAYMRDLFSERLAIEAREGGPAGFLVQRATGASRSVGLGASSRGTESRQAATAADRRPRSTERSHSPSPPRPADRPCATGEESADSVAEKSVGSATGLARSMHRRRDVSMVAAGLIVGAAGLFGGVLLLGDRKDGGEGEMPARVSAMGPAAEGEAQAAPGSPPALEKIPDEEAEGLGARPDESLDGPEPKNVVAAPMDEPAVSAGAETSTEAGRPRQDARPATGILRASVTPGDARVEVRVGGRWRPIPHRGASLSPGSHRLRITLPDGARITDTASVVAGRTRTYERSFSKGSLRVVLRPFGSGGEVRSGGRVLGTLPGPAVELYEGVHQVEIRGQDGKTARERVVVQAGREVSISVEL